MIKNVKWFFVVLVFSSLISLSFNKESVQTEKLLSGDKAPQLALCEGVQPLDLQAAPKGFTLLSFWASYDAVSRQNNAALAHLAGKYDQVKMISVSFDRYASIFRASVKQDGLAESDCFVETAGTDSKAYQTFGLERGFQNYLLDSNGVIVAKNITADELASYLN